MATEKRRDDKGRVLKTGEAQRPNGSYMFRYKDSFGNTRWCYAPSLKELREKEEEIKQDLHDGINYAMGEMSVIELIERYIKQRKGVRENTRIGYNFVFNLLNKYPFSRMKIKDVKPSDARLFFIFLHEEEHYSYSSITTVRGVLKPAFEMAAEDSIIRRNPFLFPVSEVVANDAVVRQAMTQEQKEIYNLLKKYPFSTAKIKDVKPSDARLFFIFLHEEEHYSHSSITTVRGVLKPAFEMAAEDNMIRRNPFLFPVSDVVADDAVARQAMTPEQKETYLSYLLENKHSAKYYDIVVILLETGMRISELCGLTMADIDLKNRYVKIERQLHRKRDKIKTNKNYIEKPKTKNGTRKIPLSNKACVAFSNILRNRPRPKIEPMVDGYTGFLLLDMNGNPKVAMSIEHALKRILDNYNATHTVQLPRITPHTFRHTFITDMYNRGIDLKSLQDLAGHGDIQTTLDIYTHSNYERTQTEFFRIISEDSDSQLTH